MLTLISTALSFLMGGLPKLLDFFQDKGDKKHELAMAAMQMERELKLMEAGYAAQARVEEIRTDQIQMQTQAQERTAMYQHDIEIGKGASQWVINLRASVRPMVTYLFVFLLIVVDIASIWWAWTSGNTTAQHPPSEGYSWGYGRRCGRVLEIYAGWR
jgi:hypothetical protein